MTRKRGRLPWWAWEARLGGDSGGHGGASNLACCRAFEYLDATRSTLLFARKVILVEGPAELFLIPVLVKQVLGLDLDSLGITVVPIYGVHFDVYARLFGENMLPKKCAILADGDL